MFLHIDSRLTAPSNCWGISDELTSTFQAKSEGTISLRRPVKIKKLKTGIFLHSESRPSLLAETAHADTLRLEMLSTSGHPPTSAGVILQLWLMA